MPQSEHTKTIDEIVLKVLGTHGPLDFGWIAVRSRINEHRIVDRALRRLRKSGKIRFNSARKWELV